MTNPSNFTAPTTTVVHRPLGGRDGYRVAYDRASRAVVHAFPLADLSAVSAAGLMTGAGAYVLIGDGMAYFGESGAPAQRLARHAADPEKRFALQAYVVAGDGPHFDKSLALDFQHRFTNAAVEAGVVAVVKGADPVEPALSAADRATHDRIYVDALRLLTDAGCVPFWRPGGHTEPIGTPSAPLAPTAPDEAGDAGDGGPMEIGIETGGAEFELRYCGIWARGYRSGDRFVLAAGSEVRTATNGSVDAVTRGRREQLFRAGVLVPIPGVADRSRLTVAVAFATESIAAKVACGAHSAPKWTPLPARAVVLEP